MSDQRYFSVVHVRPNLGKQLQDMSDQNTILPNILTDETKIFILSAVKQSFILGILLEFPRWGGGSFPVKLSAVCVPFKWKNTPSWVLFKYFAYFVIYCVNGCFWGTALSDCFIILGQLFILILHERKVFCKALFAGRFLINIWYCISYLLNINSALAI